MLITHESVIGVIVLDGIGKGWASLQALQALLPFFWGSCLLLKAVPLGCHCRIQDLMMSSNLINC